MEFRFQSKILTVTNLADDDPSLGSKKKSMLLMICMGLLLKEIWPRWPLGAREET